MNSSEHVQASLLLHHLLNQSLSALDFCILWQELYHSHPQLEPVHREVKAFLDEADLGALDRALALLPEPEGDSLQVLQPNAAPKVEQAGWSVKSSRIRDISSAELTCNDCGFSITLSQEHDAYSEMRLPFTNLECPICESSISDQGTPGRQTKHEP